MDFLEPRKAYHRAQTDDFDPYRPEYNTELSSLRTKSSFQNGFSNTIWDESPLLGFDADPIRKDHSHFSKTSPKSVQLPFFIWPTTLYGWRTGALTAALLAGISLLINFVVVVWLGAHGHGSSLVKLYDGDCHKVETMDIWVHLAINALSTLLLGGSNYCMQCLSAPTRQDIDQAHAKGKFLDVGVPSIRNLRSIPVCKAVLWLALGLSSVPLHLMYNSAFYKSLATNDYDIYIVTQDFVDGKPMGILPDKAFDTTDIYLVDPVKVQNLIVHNPESWDRLDNKACIDAYAVSFLDDRRTLVLVSGNSTEPANASVLYSAPSMYTTVLEFDWICNSDPTMALKVEEPYSETYSIPCEKWVKKIAAIADEWQPYGYNVQYCLSERVPQQCSYSGNVPIVAIVLVSNAIKVVIMLFVAFRLRDYPLITMGDAVESFLDRSDPTTKGLCLLSRNDVVRTTRSKKHWSISGPDKNGETATAKPARQRPRRWAASASGKRWSLTIGFLLLALVVTSSLLGFAAHTIHQYTYSIQDIGFGRVVPAAIITGWGLGVDGTTSLRILSAVLIANLPQTILSFLYLNLNGLLTSMWLASEWSDFATQRKTLRVSKPKSQQRSTHFLQLPYRIAVPLMVLSGLLHWLISQSIFLAVIAEYSPTGELRDATRVASCGFSPLAMILVIGLGGAVTIATFTLGWSRKYDPSIPLVGSCSAAIAAACHQPEWDTDASLRAVRWGAIPDIVDGRRVGHCAFSSGEVKGVLEGKEYAGMRDENWMLRRRL